MAYIGAETIISPLGTSIQENFAAISENQSGISLVDAAGFNGEPIFLSKILYKNYSFESLIRSAVESVTVAIDPEIIESDKTILIVSSTKGALDENITDQFGSALTRIQNCFKLKNQPIVVSNACVSGVLAINTGSNFVNSGIYEHAIVVGCDLISDFVVFGFQSLFAISDKPCAPFDENRNGITMGEGCAAVVISGNREIFREAPLRMMTGTSANDANHISGPSRTGEGLFRSVKKTMDRNGITANDLDYICAHGTATIYNDEMESIAFDRLGLNQIPLNSLKGYFGHTLGAAGVIETAASMQMMRHSILIKSLGYQHPGTSCQLNVIRENERKTLNMILKTASGFGGGNASLIIAKQ